MKKYKETFFYIYLLILGITVVGTLMIINKENTKALSPVGISAEENFEMVSAEFGKDFEKFIQDKAKVKIYEEDEGFLIKFGDVNFKIKNDSELINGIKEKSTEILNEIWEIF